MKKYSIFLCIDSLIHPYIHRLERKDKIYLPRCKISDISCITESFQNRKSYAINTRNYIYLGPIYEK